MTALPSYARPSGPARPRSEPGCSSSSAGETAETVAARTQAACDVEDAIAQPASRCGAPIIFIHVPKTAGTAFSHYLRRNCGAPAKVMVTFYGDYSIYDGVTDASVILGHTHYREMAARFPDASFVTWLRHPLKRVISLYKSWHNPKNLHEHWKANAKQEHRFAHIYFTQRASFDEFLTSEDPRLLSNTTNTQTGILSAVPRRRDRREVLESAKESLERNFKFVGVVERFDESIKVFQNTFGWHAEFKDDDATANRSESCVVEPSERAIKLIMARNDLDMELYEFGCKLMDRRLQELSRSETTEAAQSIRRAA
jgi:hypothetical protein